MSEWKELEISNIPSDFFVNERYMFQQETQDGYREYDYNLSERFLLIKDLQCNKFRYRLKPLEPIRITREVMEWMDNSKSFTEIASEWTNDVCESISGHPVEIID